LFQEGRGHHREVIMDPELGAFGDNGCIDFLKSQFDFDLDAQSLFPGVFTYEKYFAGKYLGEIARLVMIKLTDSSLLFEGKNVNRLREAYSFTSSGRGITVLK
jgi:hexokinase